MTETNYKLKACRKQRMIDSELNYINENEIGRRRLIFTIEDEKIEVFDTFPFFALVKLRKVLEEKDIFIMCNGSRVDVYPSGMNLVGVMAYIMILGQPGKDMVNIFEPEDDIKKIGTVEDQLIFREKWKKSFNPGLSSQIFDK